MNYEVFLDRYLFHSVSANYKTSTSISQNWRTDFWHFFISALITVRKKYTQYPPQFSQS